MNAPTKSKIRRIATFVEETRTEMGRTLEQPTRRAAAVAVIENPCAGKYIEDLSELMEIGEELGEILDHAVDALEPPYRSVFVLRDVEELSTEETAEALGLSIPAVKSRLLRARLQLREKLTRYFKRKGDDAFAYL